MSRDPRRLSEYLQPGSGIEWGEDGIAVAPIEKMTPRMEANASFFGHSKWGATYFEYENFSAKLGERWLAATGPWNDKIIVDMGCGPGNLYRNVGGSPALLIGVDVSRGALRKARDLGYTPLLADAHETPLRPGFADLVVVNATLHHCDDAARVLKEAARLVRPGGVLATDEDPLPSATRHKGLGLLASRLRELIPVVRIREHPEKSWRYVSRQERESRWKTEVHRSEGGEKGVAAETFHEVLEPLGFAVELFPHNHVAGASVLQGNRGESSARARLTQRLSGIDPQTTDAGLSVLCVATRDRPDSSA